MRVPGHCDSWTHSAVEDGIEVLVVVYLGRRDCCRHKRPRHAETNCGATTRGAYLIDVGGHNALAVVVTAMRIPVVLKLPSELEDVIALYHRQIVAEDVIFSIPVALTRILRAYAIRNESAVRPGIAADFAADLQRSPQPGQL